VARRHAGGLFLLPAIDSLNRAWVMLKRLDQILSNTGYCSRKDAKKMCAQSRIKVNDVVVRDPAEKADPAQVQLDDHFLDHPDGILVMLNKPAGFVCSHDSRDGQRIYNLLPEQWLYRNPIVSSIGRLDKDTTGLILITDYTALLHDLTSPKRHVPKTYRVTVDKPLRTDLIPIFKAGTLLLDEDPEPCLPATLTIIDTHTADLILTEGRYHQVKRMFTVLSYEVISLHRWRFGPYSLEGLTEGHWKDVPRIESTPRAG
jgi:16S rRNA pseudouridine516 synthase